MNKKLVQRFKRLLTHLGAWLSPLALHQLQLALNYMRLGRWMRANGFGVNRRLEDRTAVFSVVAEQVRDKHVLYLEFGVFRGASMRYWTGALRHPDTRLHGFDSFEGLPEAFDAEGPYKKGAFHTRGEMPLINDPRVRFFKGWFEDVLPSYQAPEHDVLVVVMDADLYSSTKVALDHLRPFIKKGTFIYFDELSRPEHEPRAFEEFIGETGLEFNLVAADHSLNNAVFECVSDRH